MIRIKVYRDKERRIYRVHIKGHANFAEHGEDIVCAAVSGVVIGLTNATEELLGIRLHPPNVSEGDLDLRIPDGIAAKRLTQVELLLEAMVSSLHSIAEDAPAHVRIEE